MEIYAHIKDMKTLICAILLLLNTGSVSYDMNIAYNLGEQFPNIEYVYVIEYGNEIAVPMRIEPIFLHSEKLAFVKEVKNFISKETGIGKDNIYVTFDSDIYSKAKRCKSDESKAELIKLVKSRAA